MWLASHNHCLADFQFELLCGGTAIHGEFQKTAGARDGDGLSARHGLINRLKRTEPFAFYNNFAGIFDPCGERGIADICNRVAESVDVIDLTFD